MTVYASARLTDRIEKLLPQIAYRKAITQAEKAEVFALRYRSYLREGAIAPNAAKWLSDEFDHSSNGQTFGVYLDGELCASVRIHVVSRHGEVLSPATQAFPDILKKSVDRGDLIIDPNRLVVDHDASRAQPDLAYVLLRVPFIAALQFGADLVTATVRLEHQAFYRRVLRFEVASPARSYPTLLTPLSLMTARFQHDAGEVQRRHPFFRPRSGEGEALFGSADFGLRSKCGNSFPKPDTPGKETTL